MKRGGILVLLLLLTGCAGLPRAREMGDTALIRTLGVDSAPEGQVEVTASSGRRARGISGEAEEPLILSARGRSISGACLAMRGMGKSQLFYGHVGQLLLGQSLGERGIWDTLGYVCGDRELGLGTQLWLISEGSAREAIRSDEENGVEGRLDALQAESRMGGAGMTRTVGETVTSLLEDGSAFLPALGVEGDNLTQRGYGVFRDGRLRGLLTGAEARGLELLMGRPGDELLELEGASVRVERARLRCIPAEEGIRLYLTLTASAEELHGEVDREKLSEEIARLELQKAMRAVKALQRLDADCAGLGRMAALSRPREWDSDKWRKNFGSLGIEGECRVTLGPGQGKEIRNGGG